VLAAGQRSSERAGLDPVVLALQVVAQSGDPLEGEVGIGVCIERSFLGLPEGFHVALGIAGTKDVASRGLCRRAAPWPWSTGAGSDKKTERIGLAAPMTEGLDLHPASALVELGVASFVTWKGWATRVASRTMISNTCQQRRTVHGCRTRCAHGGESSVRPGSLWGRYSRDRDDVEELAASDVSTIWVESVGGGTDPRHQYIVAAERAMTLPIRTSSASNKVSRGPRRCRSWCASHGAIAV